MTTTTSDQVELFGRAFRGLSIADVQAKQQTGLSNQSQLRTSRSYKRIFMDNALPPVHVILFTISIALVILGLYGDAILTAGLVVGNVAVGVFQEGRAKRHLDRIALLVRPQATVIRDGTEQVINPDDVVPGELLILRPGDQVQVDGSVVAAEGCSIDEALLTGEADLVRKAEGEKVFSGTFCMAGSAVYECEQVGSARLAQQISERAREFRNVRTPLQREVGYLILFVAVLVALLAAEVVRSFNELYGHVPVEETTRAAAVIVALVPQGLWFMITVTYSLATIRMARQGALIQRLNAVESMSHVDVLCFDKTGTLTTNALKLETVEAIDLDEVELSRVLGRFAASVSFSNRTNAAIMTGCPGSRETPAAEVAFDSERKWSALGLDGDSPALYVLGAPEVLAPHLTQKLESEKTRHWTDTGLRVLLFARAPLEAAQHIETELTLPEALTPLGYVVLRDELQPNVAEIIKTFAERGIGLKVISGDNPATVAALARQAGLPHSSETLSGADLRAMSDKELDAAVEKAAVFGRTSPAEKERLVKALQRRGHYVAMTGDGVNDVPALKAAQVAIAMGEASNVTRSVCDILLGKNAFGSLPTAFAEGQRIRKGMEAIIRLFLVRTFSIILILLGTAWLTHEFPVTPRHTAILALLTVGVPALALAAWAQPGATRRYLLPSALPFVLPAAVSIALIGIAVYELQLDRENVAIARTSLTATAVLAGVTLIPFAPNSRRHWMTREGLIEDIRMPVLAGLMTIAFLASFLVGPASRFYELASLDVFDILIVLGAFALWTLGLVYWWRLVRRVFPPKTSQTDPSAEQPATEPPIA